MELYNVALNIHDSFSYFMVDMLAGLLGSMPVVGGPLGGMLVSFNDAHIWMTHLMDPLVASILP